MLRLCAWLALLSVATGHGQDEPAPLETRTWKVPADFMERLLDGSPEEQAKLEALEEELGAQFCKFYRALPDMYEDYYEIPFPPGATVDFSPNRGELKVRNTVENLELIDRKIKSLGPMEQFVLEGNLFRPLTTLVLNGGEFPEGMVERRWHVSRVVMEWLYRWAEPPGEPGGLDPFGEGADIEKVAPERDRERVRERPLSELLMGLGIDVPDGASVSYDPETEVVESVNTEFNSLSTEIVMLDAAIEVARERALGRQE